MSDRNMLHRPSHPHWNVSNSDMFQLLGIPGRKLPEHAIPPRKIQNFLVWVEAKGPRRPNFRAWPHRIRCRCLVCNWVGSAGRTHQHKCEIK